VADFESVHSDGSVRPAFAVSSTIPSAGTSTLVYGADSGSPSPEGGGTDMVPALSAHRPGRAIVGLRSRLVGKQTCGPRFARCVG